MDAKERDIVVTVVERLRMLCFHEHDVLVMLILLREHCAAASPLRELAHFVAHRRRNRGDFHQFILREANRINTSPRHKDDALSPREFVARALARSPVYTEEAIATALGELLVGQGFEPPTAPMIDAVLLSLMSLLQDCRFDDEGHEVGRLLIAFDDCRIALLAVIQLSTGAEVMFTILSIGNRYLEFTSSDPNHVATLPNNFITVASREGRIVIRSQ